MYNFDADLKIDPLLYPRKYQKNKTKKYRNIIVIVLI